MSDFKNVTEQTFSDAVVGADRAVLVDFYADWCGPCKALVPALVDIAAEYGEDLAIVKVDIDAEPALAERYAVKSIPLMLIFDGGQMRERLVGSQPRSAIAAAVDKVVGARA